uniref:Alpha-methylacyl-CoA racemase n=1 Tax=Plectus sambesii TaxID=2011161 RepID=A0A914XV31_9BILA
MAPLLPLAGIRVIEFAGLAPVPHCGMILADFGATVIKVDRADDQGHRLDRMSRGKQSVAVDLKLKEGTSLVRRLCRSSDVLIDPFRPGVLEKLGLGPRELLADNPRLIYARLSGFGQTGPWKDMAGHDINYVALSGLLSTFGRAGQKPTAPVNLAADFAGGGLTTALGIVMALFERTRSGQGQVIDTSMVEGAAYAGSFIHMTQDTPLLWGQERGNNLLDSGAAIYDTYETADAKFVAVGALEPKFHRVLFEKLGMNPNASIPEMAMNPEEFRRELTERFKKKTRDEWTHIFAGTDACVTPVLELDEVSSNEQNKSRQSFITLDDNQPFSAPTPAPRLSRTPAHAQVGLYPKPGQHSTAVLRDFGFSTAEIEQLLSCGAAIDRASSKL